MALAGRPCPSGRPVRGITLEQREYEIEADIAADTIGYTYRKLLRVDLVRDRCEVLKSSPDGWQPGDGPFTVQLEAFARSGAVCEEDVERFVTFIQLDSMRAAFEGGRKLLSLLYRRLTATGCRWNLMEVIPDQAGAEDIRSAIFCVKDIHDALWESVEREGVSIRSQELIRSLGEQNFNIYTIDLESGTADPIRVDGQMRGGAVPLALPWDQLMCLHIRDRLQESYREAFEQRFSLEGLRRARAEGLPRTELLCQWRCGADYRYISVTAHFGQEPGTRSYTVLALQDVDNRMRQELVHTRRDAQLAAILKSWFKTLVTVNLESGQCELLDLARTAEPEEASAMDYGVYTQNELSHYVHPDDRESFLSVLSLSHLREQAAKTGDFQEESCLYRLQGEPVRWIERRVLYGRRKDQAVISILGQDVTRQKQQEETSLQALEDRAYIISSLSSLFFSTYYIDLEHDSFRAVLQLRHMEDLLGEEVNCTAALQIYANHFIHPDDRAEYLRVMNIQNLRQTLRWWQPCAAVEFRKLSEDPAAPGSGGWVRATAVLARTGKDDIPRTVVYVAQDITDNRHRAEMDPGGSAI